MRIKLTSLDGDIVALVPITLDEYGYLYAHHPTFSFEVECALYGYQDGQVMHDSIDDDNGDPYIFWAVEEAPEFEV
jgi:hypothetical protein